MTHLLVIAFLAAALYFAQRLIYTKLWAKNLSAFVGFSENEITEGERGELIEIVTNDKKLPLIMLKVKFLTSRHLKFDNSLNTQNTDNYYRHDIFRLWGGERLQRIIKFTAVKRGFYKIDSAEIVTTDLFYTKQMVAVVNFQTELYVLPKPIFTDGMNMFLQWINGEILSRKQIYEDPFEYRGIREYQPYDPMKDINWKATAKTGDLRVNLHGYTSLKCVRIFLNLEDSGIFKKENLVENAIGIAAGMVSCFLNQGMELSFYCNAVDPLNNRPVAFEKRAGGWYEKEIYRSLARIDIRKHVDFNEEYEQMLNSDSGSMFDFIITVNLYDNFVEMLQKRKITASNDYALLCPVDNDEIPVLPEDVNLHLQLIRMSDMEVTA